MRTDTQQIVSPFRELTSQLTITAVICLTVIFGAVFIALFAPWLAPHPESSILTDESFALPDDALWLGSDFLGRDMFSRLIYGARVTLSLALTIALIAFFLGTALGFLAAVKGGCGLVDWLQRAVRQCRKNRRMD